MNICACLNIYVSVTSTCLRFSGDLTVFIRINFSFPQANRPAVVNLWDLDFSTTLTLISVCTNLIAVTWAHCIELIFRANVVSVVRQLRWRLRHLDKHKIKKDETRNKKFNLSYPILKHRYAAKLKKKTDLKLKNSQTHKDNKKQIWGKTLGLAALCHSK